MERLNFETLFRIVRWDYNRCFKDESLDKDLFVEKYGKVMGEHYYNKFVHEFDGNILKMIGYFRGSEKEGQVFCDMITERIEKYEKRMSYDKDNLLKYYERNRITLTESSFEYTVLMDEPDRNLDIDNVMQIYNVLSFHKPQTQIIAIVHNPALIYKLSKLDCVNFIEMTEGYLNKISIFASN